MNFLTSAISTFTGGSIPYSFGQERVPDPNQVPTIWKLFDGTKKEDGSICTIFQFDIKKNPDLLPLAQNASRKLRGLKLPNVLQVLDTFENDSNIYIVTERVVPISELVHNEELNSDTIIYILYFIANALKYVNVEGSSVLGYIDLNNIFLNNFGEPKLGGFELCTNLKSDPDQSIYRNSSKLPGFNDFLSPEILSNGVDVLRGSQTIKFDSWRFGILIYKLFNNGTYPNSTDELIKLSNNSIPKSIIQGFKKLLSNSITVRPSIELFLKNGEQTFFNTNLINLSIQLNEFNFKNESEKLEIFQNFELIKNEIPIGLLENKILPQLLKFFNESPTNSLQILQILLSFNSSFTVETKLKFLNPVILKAFTLPDRSVRLLLLSNLSTFIETLTNSQISDKIFNNFVTGFQDSNPSIREETLKATLLIAPKLSDRQLNNELLRFLAKTQNDEKPEIRTNTTILIGKIAPHLNKSSRSTVLATAFGKALKDPFIHSRIAAILALNSSIEYFTPEIISNKILTVIAPSLLDKSSKVREEAQKSFDMFFQKIKEEAAKLPIDNDFENEEMNKVTENVANFGLNFSNTFNKLTNGLAGTLNQEQNLLTPDTSRNQTPVIPNNSFPKPEIQKKQSVDYNNWNNDNNDDDEFGNDDWGMDDDFNDSAETFSMTSKPVVSKPIPKPVTKTSSFVTPKVTSLATESKRSSLPAPKKKGLQLKPKSKLKLDLDAGAENDGWDDGW